MFRTKIVVLFALTFAAAPSLLAQQPVGVGSAPAQPAEATNERITQLESQLKSLQQQLEALRSEMQNKAASAQPAAATSAALPVAQSPSTPAEAKPSAAQTKTLGVDIGSARLTPYGTIYFNAFGNTAGTNNTDVPLFATVSGASNASATVRQTRLGMRLEGARVGNSRLSGVVEADFFGGFPSVGIGENFGVVRLRLANARLDWEKTSVTVGQDWMVFAPVNPTSLAAAAIPQMAAAGNPWARLPLVRIDSKVSKNVTLTGAVTAPQTGDFATNAAFFLQPTTGSSSRLPFFQGRLAFTDNDWLDSKKNGTIGLSGHYGRSRVFTGAANVEHEIDSAGVALDWNFPLHARVQLLGEAFWGRNLGGFQAGIFQGFNNEFAVLNGSILQPAGVRSIATRGGWMQIGFTPNGLGDRLSINGSIGLDDPYDRDLVTISRRDFRTRNLAFALNSIYKFSPQFSISAEYRHFFTHYFVSGRRDAGHVNLAAAYSF